MSAQFRNITTEHLGVGYGLVGGPQVVAPDEVITVVDAAVPSYACQPTIWRPVDQQPVTPPPPPEPPAPPIAPELPVDPATQPTEPPVDPAASQE